MIYLYPVIVTRPDGTQILLSTGAPIIGEVWRLQVGLDKKRDLDMPFW